MEGEIIIATDSGWACSNKATLDFEADVVRDPITNKPVSTVRTSIARVSGLYNVVGSLSERDEVVCLFELDDEKKLTFEGVIRDIGESSVIILIKSEFKEGESVKEVARKIDKQFN